jgi:hypothetical protein
MPSVKQASTRSIARTIKLTGAKNIDSARSREMYHHGTPASRAAIRPSTPALAGEYGRSTDGSAHESIEADQSQEVAQVKSSGTFQEWNAKSSPRNRYDMSPSLLSLLPVTSMEEYPNFSSRVNVTAWIRSTCAEPR